MRVFVSDYLKEFFWAMVKLTGVVKAPFRRNDFTAAILKKMASVHGDQLNTVVVQQPRPKYFEQSSITGSKTSPKLTSSGASRV